MKDKYQLDQVAVRMVKMPPLLSREPITSPTAAIRIINDTLKEFDRETLVVVNLQNDLKPINMSFVSLGTLDSTLAHPREILKASILSNAASIMLFHNHPSGNLEPSREDVMLTDRMQKVCSLLEIPITDHIIIGTDNRYYSFHENRILKVPKLEFAQDADALKWEKTGVAEQKQKYSPKFDARQAAADRKQEMKDITDRLEKGVSEIFQSEKYQRFLDTMARFPHYSLNNNILIMMQKPDATLCQSYTGWKQMGRYVKKGEKGIRILAPAPYKLEQERDKLDDKGKAVLDKDGEPVKETVQINVTAFKPVSTFDLSQTEGEPLPSIGVSELTGSVAGYRKLLDAITAASPVPVAFEDIEGSAKGYFHTGENRIAIQENMGEVQTVKTLIHEMAHAKLHNMEAQKARENGAQSRSSKEVEAESVAYTVCQHFGIDTSDYSFAYVAGWSHGKEMPELKESLNTIRTAASELITAIDEKVQEMTAEKGLAQTEKKEKAIATANTWSEGKEFASRATSKKVEELISKTARALAFDQTATSGRKPSVRRKLQVEKQKEAAISEKSQTRTPRTKHKEEAR